MIITIDGPAGAGKSTAARLLAERLGFEFLDTGAMYRAVAWACVDRGIDLKDVDAVAETAAGISIQFEQDRIICNGQDVTTDIRSAEASHAASIVAAVPAVRLEMVRLQRESAAGHRYVTEGRDQGSEVFPDSECKFFLTADPQERAERRLLELQNRGQSESIEEVLTQIIDRDERDRSREIGPLVKADDAIEVDTSGKTIEQVVDFLEQTSRERLSLLRL
jgi:cytidylate kinase